MPGWGDILNELTATINPATGQPDFDTVRRKYIHELHALTGNPTVVYATDWLSGNGGPQSSITLSDMQGLMEVFRDLDGDTLDLILHSPGGQAEATDRLVRYTRAKYKRVRIFVPLAGMSAATMWAMSADELVMGKHSQLGPIDPQITLPSGITVPAGALIEQFNEAQNQCETTPAKLTAWLPTLQQYPPGILNVCENASQLAEDLVAEWLRTYMFATKKGGAKKAKDIARWLADDVTHLSHGRAITREDLRAQGLPVTDLEDDPALQDAVLSVHHATMHTLGGSAVKIIENNIDRAFVQHGGMQMVIPQGGPGALIA